MASKKKSKDIAKRRQIKQQKKARIKKTREHAAPVLMPGKKNQPQLFQKLENMGLAGDLHEPEYPLIDTDELSATIIDYAEPLLGAIDQIKEPGDEFGHRKAMIEMAILMWNLALLPKDSLTEAKKRFVQGLREVKEEEEAGKETGGPVEEPTDEMPRILTMLDMMCERKWEHFAEDQRFVLDYSFGDEDDDEDDLAVVGIFLTEEIMKELVKENGTGEDERGTGHRPGPELAED